MKRNGIDPQIDEEMMIEFVSKPKNEEQHAAGVLMVLIDAWDREIDRAQFLSVAAACMNCADGIGRYGMMTAVEDFLKKNDFIIGPQHTTEALTKARDGLTRTTGDIRKFASLLAQCALSEDPIH